MLFFNIVVSSNLYHDVTFNFGLIPFRKVITLLSLSFGLNSTVLSYCLILTNSEEHVHIKYNPMFFDGDASVVPESSRREFAHTKELWESEQPARTAFSPKFLTL